MWDFNVEGSSQPRLAKVQHKKLAHKTVVTVIVAHIYPPVTRQRQTLIVRRSTAFHCNDYFVLDGIRTFLGVSSDPMSLWISSNFGPLNLLLF